MTGLDHRPSAVAPPADAEFVLDDDLDEDEDEDMLAFQSTREAANNAMDSADSTPTRPAPPAPIRAKPPTPLPSQPASSIPALTLALGPSAFIELEVTGLPIGCTRAHLEALVGANSLRAIRLGATLPNSIYGPSTLVVPPDAAARVLALSNPVVLGTPVHITEKTLATRLAGATASARAALATAGEHLPLAQLAEAAGNVRDAFEVAATDTRVRLEELDRRYELSEKGAAVAAAAAAAARSLDDAVGASRGASAVADAASVVAREVDENWRVSERARLAANAALEDERTAPAARILLGAVATPDPSNKSRKTYTPSAERRNPEVPVDADGTRAALEF